MHPPSLALLSGQQATLLLRPPIAALMPVTPIFCAAVPPAIPVSIWRCRPRTVETRLSILHVPLHPQLALPLRPSMPVLLDILLLNLTTAHLGRWTPSLGKRVPRVSHALLLTQCASRIAFIKVYALAAPLLELILFTLINPPSYALLLLWLTLAISTCLISA